MLILLPLANYNLHLAPAAAPSNNSVSAGVRGYDQTTGAEAMTNPTPDWGLMIVSINLFAILLYISFWRL